MNNLLNKTEKIIVEDGEKKKVIKIIKVMEDGSKQIETVKEIVEEYRKGYKIGSKVLRHSMVKVKK